MNAPPHSTSSFRESAPAGGSRQALFLDLTAALVTAPSDLASLTRLIFERVGPALQADVCFNYRRVGGDLLLVAGFGIPTELFESAQRLQLGQAFCGEVAAKGAPLRANCTRVQDDPKGAFVRGMGVRAYMCHPLFSRSGELLGTLSFASRTRDEFSPEDTEFLQTLCHFLSLAWERHDAERSLREKEERLRQLTESIREVFWLYELASRKFIYVSPAYEVIWGRSCQSLYGDSESWTLAIHPEDRRRVEEDRLKLTSVEHQTEFRIVRPDGVVRWVSIRSFPVRDDENLLWRIAGVAEDISDRKRAELELQHVRFTLEAAQERAHIGSWELDLATGERWWSKEMYSLFDVAPEQPVPSTEGFLAMVHPEDRERLRAMVAQCIETGNPFTCDFRSAPGRGQARHYTTLFRRDERHGGRRVTGVTQDVSERRDAEQTRERLESQLRQAQKMEALGTLAGGIAHDFNNLLLVMLGNAELAREDLPEGTTAASCFDEIRQAGTRARDLVQRILAFSRPVTPQRTSVRLKELAEEIVKLLRSTLPAGVELAVIETPGTPEIQADAAQLHQVLLNLATNSWHAMEGGTGRIEFIIHGCRVDSTLSRLHRELHPGRYAVLSVKDNGKGIPAEVIERIFEPFFTTKPPGLGTGLGLSMVHGIMRSHGGAVIVESRVGRGTTFHLYFPAENRDGEVQERLPGSERPPPAKGRGERILYVDDEVSLVNLCTRVLQNLGYRVTGCERPAEALERLQKDPGAFDLVVTDFNMPGMSGLELARQLRNLRRDLPIILLSGYVPDDMRERAADLNVREVIYKPNVVDDLAATVRRVLDEAAADPQGI